MNLIRLLPSATADRIAAGEVVERPAAAVKELVENALDAGARHIFVALEGGGLSRILVEDDGSGMSAGDLLLAVERHATSKLPDEATLFAIKTLGFRGEALPSIAAVARVTITSRMAGGDAHRLAVEAGRRGEVVPASGAPGTRIEVRDLFFATPARRKFMKTPPTEAAHAVEAVRRLALAWPEVAFRAEVEGREVLNLAASDRAGRVAALLGPDFARACVPVSGLWNDLALDGLAALPTHTRATGAEQHLVVNRRPVRDPQLRAALRVAYRDLIANGRHPVAALFLDLPPEAVDVNVHPMKTELRFRDAANVRGALISALRRALAVGAGTAATASAGAAELPEASAPDAPGFAEAPQPDGFMPPAPRPGGGLLEEWTVAGWRPGPPRAGAWQPGLRLPAPQPAQAAEPAPPPPAPPEEQPLGRPLAQLMETYILSEAPDGALVLVDQHAAHERLMHEQLRAQFLEGRVRSQPLLLPAVVEMPALEAARLTEAAPALARLGLEIEGFGGSALLVRAMPALLGNPDPAPLLRDLAAELAEWEEATALDRRLDGAIARMACHGSIRAGRRLKPEEMAALLRQMEATPRAATCSHGRPTFLRFGKAEFEKLFGRR
ncbi:DNA mismatch repair endonuclease MutL [Roseomonas marmotae]|uniref:DNA mismatch repair protein MutL n=1 Tax=Roseomonas marmotae TaxID=2768161 RepID=A0ABS3K7J8_9PROT|nr:DNA mismatch repair endonuclease MutL [Roseomonas marmotae]MBO1073450.1 DNA mismatch repair endonuclease MutL [Roseomonas marmotae]QTI80354.1 DNA mismatch repair endonuclease MutL [Roseomonas marmotae]